MDAQRCVGREGRPATLLLAAGMAAAMAIGLAGCAAMPTGTATSTSPAAQSSAAPSGPSSAVPSAPPSAAPSTPPSSSAPAQPPAASPSPRPSTIPAPDAEDVDASTPDGPVAAAPLPTAEAAITEPIALTTGMVIELVSVEAIEVTAQTPGELDGSAVRVTVSAHNESAEPQSVDSAVVTVTVGSEVGIGTTAGDPAPLHGDVAPGDTVTAEYVFMLDRPEDREITVSVNYAAGEPVAVFTGSTS